MNLRDLKNAIKTLEQGKQLFPRDAFILRALGSVYGIEGRFEDAIAEYREAVRLAPTSLPGIYNLAIYQLLLNRLDEVKKVVQEAKDLKVESAATRRILYMIAFLEGGTEALQREIEAAKDRDPTNLGMLAQAAAYSGKVSHTAKLIPEIRTRAREVPERAEGTDSVLEALFSFIPPLFGIQGSSDSLSQSLKSLTPSSPIAPERVLRVALADETKSAEILIEEIHKESPEDTLLNFVWIPTFKAVLKIHEGRADEAIELLRGATAYEPGITTIPAIYVRGWAYLENKSGPEAAAEFRKIADHRTAAFSGYGPLSPFYPLSHLGLGRAYALMGDAPKARKSYEDFFAIWKDADPDIPILIQAKKEYAQLPAKKS